MEVKPERSEHGFRWTAEENGEPTAQIDKLDGEESVVTFSWRGRVDLETIFSFFQSTWPGAPSKQEHLNGKFRAVVFGPEDAITLEDYWLSKLKKEIPAGCNFVRLEHDRAAKTGTNGTDFAVWARVDLMNLPTDVHGPDDIAVWGSPNWLQNISVPLGKFVSATHVNDLPVRTAMDSVNRLLQTLAPK